MRFVAGPPTSFASTWSTRATVPSAKAGPSRPTRPLGLDCGQAFLGRPKQPDGQAAGAARH